MGNILPVGKLPPEILRKIIAKAPISAPGLLMGPGIGLDCGIVDNGSNYLVLKTDPITFATEEIGWYAIQIIANDLATTGATPKWLMVTALFPENKTDEALIEAVTDQLFSACREMKITLVNAHTEITYGIDRPILMCSLVGEVAREKLITAWGAKPGNDVLITKGIPIEGTALLAREFAAELKPVLTPDELRTAQAYIHQPGIGVSADARIAISAGRVTAMHDPTEGGLASALWELSEACGYTVEVDLAAVPVSAISQKVCGFFGLNPLNTIASGALLMAVDAGDTQAILQALESSGIACSRIGRISNQKKIQVFDRATATNLYRPEQDEIARIFSK